jgi:hypothetical protein
MANQTFTLGIAGNLTANSFTFAGKTFTGWNTLANGGGTAYADGEAVTDLTSTGGATVKLYAQWMTPLTGTGDIATYLGSASGGANADSPVPLALNLQLTADNWAAVLSAVNTAGKFVSLDLSACTAAGVNYDPGLRSGGGFDPNPYSSTGKNKIVHLTLPAAATSIVSSSSSSLYSFKYFTALKTVIGAEVTNIGDEIFYDSVYTTTLTALTSVSFPEAVTIGRYAFSKTSLTSANFPKATQIGAGTFNGCTKLTSLSIPAAASIGQSTFQGATKLNSVTLGATPPALGTNILYFILLPQTVTVRIPESAKDAYGVPGLPGTNFDNSAAGNSWGKAFKGLGWSGGESYGSGSVNTVINLVFQTYTPEN